MLYKQPICNLNGKKRKGTEDNRVEPITLSLNHISGTQFLVSSNITFLPRFDEETTFAPIRRSTHRNVPRCNLPMTQRRGDRLNRFFFFFCKNSAESAREMVATIREESAIAVVEAVVAAMRFFQRLSG